MIYIELTDDEFKLLKSLVGSMHLIILNGLKAPLKKSNKLEAEKLNGDIEKLIIKFEDFELKGGVNNG